MISIHDLSTVEEFCRSEKIDPQWLKRVRRAFYKQQRGKDRALEELPQTRRKEFAANVAFHSLTLEEKQDSRVDNATKLLFRTTTGRLVESVILRIATGRTSLCVSSQVGCAAGCRFCATGKMGFAENLSAADMLDQVVHANQLLAVEDRRIRNVVFMGMGEPLNNEENLCGAMELLHATHCFDLPPRRTTVSTVGIPDAMVRLARRFPQVGIALSLHSARAEIRERLIPVARRYGLADLRSAMDEIVAFTGQPVMIECLLLKGINDSADDAAALIDYLQGLLVHVNLISYNAIDGLPEFEATDQPGREQFAAALRSAGLTVTLRYSLGTDIAAACGQLAGREPQPSENESDQ